MVTHHPSLEAKPETEQDPVGPSLVQSLSVSPVSYL